MSIGSAKTVQVNSGFLGCTKGDGANRRWFAKRVTWLGADEIPSLSVILQPSGGLAIFAGKTGKSRKKRVYAQMVGLKRDLGAHIVESAGVIKRANPSKLKDVSLTIQGRIGGAIVRVSVE